MVFTAGKHTEHTGLTIILLFLTTHSYLALVTKRYKFMIYKTHLDLSSMHVVLLNQVATA